MKAFKWLSVIKNIGVIVIACTLGFLVSEAALRVYHVFYPIYYISAYKLFTYNPVFGNWHKPNVHLVWRQESRARVYTNSSGMIGAECIREKPAGVFRIAVVGDSYTEALQVSPDRNFCSQLERLLNVDVTRTGTDQQRRYEVLNFGVSGQGTAQEYLVLKHMALQFDPDLVIAAFCPQNDLRNNNKELQKDDARPYFMIDRTARLVLDPSAQRAFDRYIRRHTQSLAYRLLNIVRDHSSVVILGLELWKQYRLHATHPSDEQSSRGEDARIPVFYPPQTVPWFNAWDITELLIKEMHSFCAGIQIPFVLLQVTMPEQVNEHNLKRYSARYPGDDEYYVEKRMSRFCSANGIPYIPLARKFKALEQAMPNLYFHGFGGPGKEEFGHWNESGHAYCAQFIAEFLREKLGTGTVPQNSKC